MIIDVIDMEDSTTRAAGDSIGVWNLREITRLGTSHVIQLYGMCNGVEAMIDSVMEVAGLGLIEALRIWGHGTPGSQAVSAGDMSAGEVTAHWAGISLTNFEAMAPILGRLTPYFSPCGRVELRGCSVADQTDGEQLLLQLAALWCVPVYAGRVTQRTAHSDWIPPVTRATPGGSLSSTSGIAVR